MNSEIENKDHGAHYRYVYRVKLTEQNIKDGFVDVKLDPFRISLIYEMSCFAMQTILKKCLKAGERGHKDLKQDLLDIINAANRKLEMIEEDDVKNNNALIREWEG